MIRTCAIALLLFAGSADAAPADDYADAWPLTLTGDSAAWQVELTPEVYAAVRDPQLRDVTVLDGAGQPVPIAPRRAEASTVAAPDVELPQFALPRAASVNAESLDLRVERDADGKLRKLDAGVGTPPREEGADLLLDASALHASIESLDLDWDESAASASAQFAIAGSDDLQHWRTLVSSATVMNLRQDGNVLSRHRVALGASSAYLRLHRIDAGKPLPNLRVRARPAGVSTLVRPALVWLDAVPLPPDPDTKSAGYRYRLSAPLDVEAIRLELGSDNSLARVAIASRPHEGGENWQTRAEFTAFRLHQGDSLIGNDEVTIGGGPRAQEWRVLPATPLDRAPTLRVAFRPDRFVFLAQGNGPYRLAAGSAKARRGDYPVDTAVAQLRTRLGADWQPPLAALGARTTLAGERALVIEAERKVVDWKSWLLWGVLIAAAAVVGGLALNLLRDADKR